MKSNSKARLFSLLLIVLSGQHAFTQYIYPAIKIVSATDTYWGQSINDPYRWLEDLKDPEVLSWFTKQSDYTNSELAKISGQDKLLQEMRDLDRIVNEDYRPVAKAGGKYFYQKRKSGEPTAKLYFKQILKGEEVLLFDPQKYIEGKTMSYEADISDDGSKILLNLHEAGTEVGDIRILNVQTGLLLPDSIPHAVLGRFVGGSNKEIVYIEYKSYDTHDPEVMLNTPSKLHVLGTPVSSDKVIISSQKNPELDILPSEFPRVFIFKDSPYMIFGKYTVDNNLILFYALKSELKKNKIDWHPLTNTSDEVTGFYLRGKDIFFLTAKGNPKFKIIKTTLERPDVQSANVIFEGNDEWKISRSVFIHLTKDYLVFTTSKNELISKVVAYELKSGKLLDLSVPIEGIVRTLSFSKNDNEVLLIHLGWNVPLNFYLYDIEKRAFKKGAFHMEFNYPQLQEIAYEEIDVQSHDGVMVPLSIVYNKSMLKKDGSNVCLMDGYGAYGMSRTPFFSSQFLPLLNRGVILAYAHVRGGGERGNEWHLGGRKTTKHNTWKDFNSCAEYLIRNMYTSSKKFGITSTSAGGILIGRAITERPDLYQAAIIKEGVLNSLRMEFSPNGPDNIPEFGTVKDSTEFYALWEMDAYHHIQNNVKYPAQLITTGFNDPRVESYIPAKFAARMQAENGSTNPVFLDVDFASGHFGRSTMNEQWIQRAKEYAFLLWQCGVDEFKIEK